MKWKTQAMLSSTVRRPNEGTHLMVLLYEVNDQWALFALSAPSLKGLDVLENHAHKFLGFEQSLQAAMFHANDYTKVWLSGDDDPDDCECDEIELLEREHVPADDDGDHQLDLKGTEAIVESALEAVRKHDDGIPF